MAQWVQMKDCNLVNLDHITAIWIFTRKASDGETVYNVTLCGHTEDFILTTTKSYDMAMRNLATLNRRITDGLKIVQYAYETEK